MTSMTKCQPRDAESTNTQTIAPRVDIVEAEDSVKLFADMPGVESSGVDVRFENGELSMHGKRTSRGREIHFYRNFTLGEHLATDRISAEIKHGVLTLTVPKVEAVKPRKIPVNG